MINFTEQELQQEFQYVKMLAIYQPGFNIPPQSMIPVILEQDGQKAVDSFQWGLIPHWTKDSRIANKLTNARSEGIKDTPSYRDSFRQWRCIVPMSGFYEWTSVKIGQKQPYYFSMKDKPVFGVASIYSIWKNPEGQAIYSVSLVTCASNEIVSRIHDRMPAILQQSDYDLWLNTKTNQQRLLQMLTPYVNQRMQSWPVTRAMSSTDFQEKECIKEIKITQTTLL